MHAHLPRDGQRRNRRPSAALICERPIEKDRQAHAWLCSTASPRLLGLGPYSPSTSAYRLSAVKKNPPMGGQETAPLTLFSEGKARQDVATDYPGEFRSFSNGRVFSRADTMRNGGKMWTTVWCSHASMATAPAAAGRTASAYQTRRAIVSASPETDRMVRITAVPHGTQLWVTSSRSAGSLWSANARGVTDVIAIRCPHSGHGRRRLGNSDCTIHFRPIAPSFVHCSHSLPIS